MKLNRMRRREGGVVDRRSAVIAHEIGHHVQTS